MKPLASAWVGEAGLGSRPGEGTFIVIPAQVGIQEGGNWIPTFVGMTYKGTVIVIPA